MKLQKIELLKECEYGGCSAKIDPYELSKLLSKVTVPANENVLVGLSTHDDAGVYKLNEETALIMTTDFFPPVVDEPYTFGVIAATNALSDVYAMGGKPLMALNLMHYPGSRLPLGGLLEILRGGQQAIDEAGAFTMGGHTIEDKTPQYGLAVVGVVHPNKIVTNGGARSGQKLILTKPLGVGVMIAGQRLSLTRDQEYKKAVDCMQRLNKYAAQVMCDYAIRGATDVTGFGLVGHGFELAEASDVTIEIDTSRLPVLPGVLQLLDDGCIPGAAFRNIRYVGAALEVNSPLLMSYLAADPQTSGGLLMAVDSDIAEEVCCKIHDAGDRSAAIIGEVKEARKDGIKVVLN